MLVGWGPSMFTAALPIRLTARTSIVSPRRTRNVGGTKSPSMTLLVVPRPATVTRAGAMVSVPESTPSRLLISGGLGRSSTAARGWSASAATMPVAARAEARNRAAARIPRPAVRGVGISCPRRFLAEQARPPWHGQGSV
jgi:hypothetical protein